MSLHHANDKRKAVKRILTALLGTILASAIMMMSGCAWHGRPSVVIQGFELVRPSSRPMDDRL